MPTELRNLRIKRVSLVDVGANQAADVVLFKAHPIHACIRKLDGMSGDEPAASFDENIAEMEGYAKADEAMCELWPATDVLRSTIRGIYETVKGDDRKAKLKEAIGQYVAHVKEKLAEIAKGIKAGKEGAETMDAELKKQLDELNARIAKSDESLKTLAAEALAVRTENDELRKRLAGIKPEEKPDTTPVTKADLSKLDSASRETVEKMFKRLEDSEARVSKLQYDGELALETQRIEKQYRSIPEEPAREYAKLLLKHAKGSEERATIEKLMEAANLGANEILSERGTAMRKSADGDPMVKINKAAAELRKADPKLSQIDALEMAYQQNPELAREIEEER